MAKISDEEQRVWDTIALLAPQAIKQQRAASFKAGWDAARSASISEHDHEFEDCCVICGKTWHEVNG